jgi:NAD(P)-dependent dehydrogenase (short-subunit alcohol dehydrogenase family)
MDLRGKSALVTGASRGLGRSLAFELARRGARLVLVARSAGPLQRVAEEIRAAGGVAHAIPADVGEKRSIHVIAGTAAAVAGPIDLLVLNASTLGPVPLRLLLDTECEDLERVLAVNLIGPFRLAKVIAGSMVVRGSGLVLSVSSDAAVEAYPRWGAYSVSKAALDHLARVLAAELAGTGVRVLSVDPGEMDTDMHSAALPEADRERLAKPEAIARRILAMIEDESIATGARVLAQPAMVTP